jgi:hypothetical protein
MRPLRPQPDRTAFVFLDSSRSYGHNKLELRYTPPILPARVSAITHAARIAMYQWFSNPYVELLVSCTILALMIAAAVYALGKFRGGAEEEQLGASELLSKFREMHAQGGLSDAEFRTIKTLLADKLQREIKNSGDKG